MKKILTIMIAAMMAFGIVACGSKDKTSENSIVSEENNSTSENLVLEREGAFYGLNSAYDKEYLSIDDLMHVSYYKSGEVCAGKPFDNPSQGKIDFQPKRECPALDVNVENDIKRAFYKAYENRFFNAEGERLGDYNDLFVKYYGCYNNTYVVEITSSLWDFGAAEMYLIFEGFYIAYSASDFLAFRYE